jgi:hypothetical protein
MPEKYSSFKIKSIFYGRAKVIAIISIVLIISISYGLFFTSKLLQKVMSKIIYLLNKEIVRLWQQEFFLSILRQI